MYRITTMFPEDPRQPFYNANSSKMTPLARLYIRKTKNIPRNCDDRFLQSQVLDVSENTEEEVRGKCALGVRAGLCEMKLRCVCLLSHFT